MTNSGASAATLTFAPAATATFAGAIQDGANPLALAMDGPGTQFLSGVNTYSGGTTVNAGTLEFVKAASLPGYKSGSVTVAGGAVLAVQPNINGTSGWSGSQIDSLVTSANWLNNAAVLGIDTTQGSFAYGGSISQALSLTKLGANTLILTGSNTYSGVTTVSSGTLQVGNGGSGASIGGSSGVILANNSALVFNHAGSSSVAGAITGNGSLTKTGPGTLILDAPATFTGPTTINQGTLQLAPPPTNTTSSRRRRITAMTL